MEDYSGNAAGKRGPEPGPPGQEVSTLAARSKRIQQQQQLNGGASTAMVRSTLCDKWAGGRALSFTTTAGAGTRGAGGAGRVGGAPGGAGRAAALGRWVPLSDKFVKSTSNLPPRLAVPNPSSRAPTTTSASATALSTMEDCVPVCSQETSVPEPVPRSVPGPLPGSSILVNDDLERLTKQTGTLMSMAPEVLKGQKYNEKADGAAGVPCVCVCVWGGGVCASVAEVQ